MPQTTTNQTKTLRQKLRNQRLQLTPANTKRFGYLAARQFQQIKHRSLHKNAKIAVFVDAFAELPTQALIDKLTRRGCEIYLPVVTHRTKPLSFVKLNHNKLSNNRLITHRFGMQQPAKGKRLRAKQLDVIIMPLVAVDKQGHRLGMGGGFYDKSLAKCHQKPLKIGWAYDFQLVDNLVVNAWDIGVDMAVFPSLALRFCRYLI
ncbi:5-formyltetrahydrofolate cyclo-ligase [Moraxella macacae 0408225]|uniref:5-formyltetrahydrofolate cyclo-ligase n=1 Tax=Moraxella macacae 0408225 TaxID=1230338 RepID=L2F7P4_9GAMM|nr:5-formyltetrahydrofolate cyclo-ligase [Moraxella macacae]ELA08801.1 5-formyltetrahydrofolate cyclo-ligase [Moraxella macacae 0408225]